MAITPSTPRPAPSGSTPPRPMPPRPAPQQKAKSSAGPKIGLIVASILAVAGLGGAGFLYSKQGGLTAENSSHQQAALAAAETLGITIDTNAPTDWTDLWSKVNAAITTMKGEGERQTVRLSEAESEIATASEALQKAQSDATRSAQQATELNTRLTALQESSAAQLKAVESKLNEAQQALEAAEAKLATAPEVAEAAAEESAEVATEAASAAPAAAAVATAAVATAAVVTETTEAAGAEANAAPPKAPIKGSYEFPGPRNEVLKAASYDEAKQTLTVTLVDDTDITYSQVPSSVYERLSSGAPTYEVFYRMKVMGAYPADRDDKAAVRALGGRR